MDKNNLQMITVALTTYNRTDMLYESIAHIIDDKRISEIVISDDCSPHELYNSIAWKYHEVEKVKCFRNDTNLDCYKNKRQAIKRSTNEWVVLLDSDNIIRTDFIDTLFEQGDWNHSWAYAPEFARPHFDFTKLTGETISKNNISSLLPIGNCATMLNAMNYFVNRDEYLRVWDGKCDPVTSDSLYHNYNWIKGGNSIHVTAGLQYDHRVHDGSHYKNNVQRTPRGFHNDILNKIKNL